MHDLPHVPSPNDVRVEFRLLCHAICTDIYELKDLIRCAMAQSAVALPRSMIECQSHSASPMIRKMEKYKSLEFATSETI